MAQDFQYFGKPKKDLIWNKSNSFTDSRLTLEVQYIYIYINVYANKS